MLPITDKIFKIISPLGETPLGYVNCYLLITEKGNILIDTGWNTPEALETLHDQLRELSLSIKDLDLIITTHAHVDHCGLIAMLQKFSNVKTAMHASEAVAMKRKFQNPEQFLALAKAWLMRAGVSRGELFSLLTPINKFIDLSPPCMIDLVYQGGERLDFGDLKINLLLSPGHSTGHLCLYEPGDKLLFTGDHILPEINPVLGDYLNGAPRLLADYLDALHQINFLEVKLALPGHREPFGNFHERVEQIAQHHRLRAEIIWGVLDDGEATVYEVAARIKWHSSAKTIPWPHLSPNDKRLSLLSVFTHLQALQELGALESREKGGVLRFQPRKGTPKFSN